MKTRLSDWAQTCILCSYDFLIKNKLNEISLTIFISPITAKTGKPRNLTNKKMFKIINLELYDVCNYNKLDALVYNNEDIEENKLNRVNN
jgi:hypothetical protein